METQQTPNNCRGEYRGREGLVFTHHIYLYCLTFYQWILGFFFLECTNVGKDYLFPTMALLALCAPGTGNQKNKEKQIIIWIIECWYVGCLRICEIMSKESKFVTEKCISKTPILCQLSWRHCLMTEGPWASESVHPHCIQFPHL